MTLLLHGSFTEHGKLNDHNITELEQRFEHILEDNTLLNYHRVRTAYAVFCRDVLHMDETITVDKVVMFITNMEDVKVRWAVEQLHLWLHI